MGKLCPSLPLVVLALLAAGPSHAMPCNATVAEAGQYVGCLGIMVHEPVDCYAIGTSQCESTGIAAPCDTSGYGSKGSVLDFYCPLFDDGGAAQQGAYPDCNSVSSGTGMVTSCAGTSLGAPQACATASTTCNLKGASCNIGTARNSYNVYCPTLSVAAATSDPPSAVAAAAEAKRRKEAEEAQQKRMEETLAQRKKLESELAAKGGAAVNNQADALKNADELSATGMNQAANIGAVWCAAGANAHKNDKDLAEESYGNCKNYMGAADSIKAGRGRNEDYKVDNDTINGDWASGVLSDFEKNFGVAAGDFMGKLLGSSDRAGDLADMTKGKIKPEDLAEAYANGKGKDAFELSLAGKGGPKKASLRGDLKKALADEAKRKPASGKGDNLAAAVDKRKEKDSIEGLKPLEDQFAGPQTEELTIFQVVHRKYEEIFAERRKL